jgi:hypothetical protein
MVDRKLLKGPVLQATYALLTSSRAPLTEVELLQGVKATVADADSVDVQVALNTLVFERHTVVESRDSRGREVYGPTIGGRAFHKEQD